MKSSTFALILLWACGPLDAVTPDYWPFEPGNQWVYRASGRVGTEFVTLEVVRNEIVDGRVYSVLRRSEGGDVWLRMDEDGRLHAWNPQARQESLWADFGAPTGSTYETGIDPCNRQARIESRRAGYRGPLGDFNEALHIVYPPGSCADAGITDEYYLPYVGLARRDTTTIAGPRRLDLIYARLGGITVLSEPSLTFTLSLDRSVYTANLMPPVDPGRSIPQLTARLSLRNGQGEPLQLVFPSGQSYDLAIRNEKGDVVYRWSDGRMFTQVFRRETLAPGHERNHFLAIPLGGGGAPLPEGRYTAEGWLAVEGPPRYSARVGFEVRYVH